MTVAVFLVVVIVLLACLLVAADHAVKVAKRVRRRKDANRRFVAAAAAAEAKHSQRKATAEASGALTSVMPTIHDIDPRLVGPPALGHDGTPHRP